VVGLTLIAIGLIGIYETYFEGGHHGEEEEPAELKLAVAGRCRFACRRWYRGGSAEAVGRAVCVWRGGGGHREEEEEEAEFALAVAGEAAGLRQFGQ
jgi:hypothetical protein